MSAKTSVPPGSAKVAVQISYCPELCAYHYIRTDGDEFFFDDDKLEQSISVYLSQGKRTDAEYMALLTADARKHPHKILIYEGGKPPRIVDPVRHSFDDASGPGGKLGKKE
jgi:hypothetical protein